MGYCNSVEEREIYREKEREGRRRDNEILKMEGDREKERKRQKKREIKIEDIMGEREMEEKMKRIINKCEMRDTLRKRK